MIFLRTCAALLIILMWGDLLYGFIAPDDNLSVSPGRRAGLIWIWGSGLVSWLLFVGLWAGFSLNGAVTILSLVGGVVWIVRWGSELVWNGAKALTPGPSPDSGEGSRASDGVRAVPSQLAFYPNIWQTALSLSL
jgi:hypothetical protein